MKAYSFIIALIAACMLAGCTREKHFITDEAIRRQVAADLAAKQALLPHGNLFAALAEGEMTAEEREALSFLYAYMPVGDAADYSGGFYLENIRASFRAREEMPWGREIPEAVFRHFVLPVRVNNENLDRSRMAFYDALKDRVRGLPLADAVLEVNHWCHEKVVYTPSDARTSSPLATVCSASGRCGEESVFTVAALRAVGIPARQVYTPRWAHTDDNHAWVEAWVDGTWRFMGACEPEPVLNLGWFNAPAYRGMLMHTKVFGRYRGPEEIMDTTACYTEINVTDHYAPTARCTVSVTDAGGQPVPGATVEFKLYNYAEFYTVATKQADNEGKASLTAGKGDMLVWATGGGRFGFRKVSFGKDAGVSIPLDKAPGDAFDLPLDVVPPVEGAIPANVTDEQTAANARRLHAEDSIRNAYVATFYPNVHPYLLHTLAEYDTEDIRRLLTAASGNWDQIWGVMFYAQHDSLPHAVGLLDAVSAKDLRDTRGHVLLDHLRNAPDSTSRLYVPYVLNPRVDNELLTAYRSFFVAAARADTALGAMRQDPHALAGWVKEHITVDDALNPQAIPVSPIGVWKARVADAHSRDIFFVALARSLGIPARIEPVAGKVQYHDGGRWTDAGFGNSAPSVSPQGAVEASYRPIRTLGDPKYYSHFTIARLGADARLQTLNFEAGSDADLGAGDTWSALLRKPLPLDTGHYLLVTGTRMAHGNVLANLSTFDVTEGRTTRTRLVMREDTGDVQVIGSIDAEARFRLAGSGTETSILSTTGRGYFIIALLGAKQEPTNHALRDIAAFRKDFEAWNRPLVFLFRDENELSRFDRSEFADLPSTVTYGVDAGQAIAGMLSSALHLSDAHGTLPVFVIADTFGRVVFVSQGYTIGLGAQLMKVIRQL